MNKNDENKHDIIDEDLYEEIDEEELYELVQEERNKILDKQRKEQRETNQRKNKKFPKWVFWLIAFVMIFHVVAILPQTFSIPAIDFLVTSAKLSANEDIQNYKQSVVVIETDTSKGTGFSISSSGTIVTNYHVVDGEETVTVAFPEDGLFSGKVVETYPDIDLAVLEANGENLPHLQIAEEAEANRGDPIYFIGNPLRFQGIANEGNIIERTQLTNWDDEVFMLDAPVYRGNSGSPVIDQEGKVIGVVFATMNHDNHGRVGLFVPIELFHLYQHKQKGEGL